MLLTISTTRVPATDLGFLLVKHPDRVQSFTTTGGTAYVWYPEATPQRCTAALLLDVDPVGLARPAKGQRSPDGFSLGRYVNDRPYAASSLLTVALGRVFRSALNGTSRDRSPRSWSWPRRAPATPAATTAGNWRSATGWSPPTPTCCGPPTGGSSTWPTRRRSGTRRTGGGS